MEKDSSMERHAFVVGKSATICSNLGKLALAVGVVIAAFSAGALEHGLMRIPDSLAPRREEIVNEVGNPNAVSIPLPGGGSMMLQNEMGGGVMSSPIPVHAVEAVEAFCGKLQKGKSIAAEVSGTTWFACALKEVDFDGQRCSFFHGPIVVKGYCFVLYLRTPADRGLDASVRAVLRQVTLLPPEDGNSEPTIPLVKMDLAKVPPVKDIPEWAEIAEAHKRTVETAAKAEDQPQGRTPPKAVPLPPLPAVVTAPKAPTVKPLVSDDFMNASMRKAAIAHVRESLRELLGPMSDEADAAFEKRWNAVSDYSAPEILDWLKKASPIISELVRLKASVDAGIVACDDALREAAYAQTFGNAAAEREQMRTYAEILTAMKTAQARMNALQRGLDELGEMPDPREVEATARRATIEAEQAVKELVGVSGKNEESSASPDVPVAEAGEYWVLTKTTCQVGNESMGEDAVGSYSGKCSCPWVEFKDYGRNGLIGEWWQTSSQTSFDLKFSDRQVAYAISCVVNAYLGKKDGKLVHLNEHEIDRTSRAYEASWTIPEAIRVEKGSRLEVEVKGNYRHVDPKVGCNKEYGNFDRDKYDFVRHEFKVNFGSRTGVATSGDIANDGTLKLSQRVDVWKGKAEAVACLTFQNIPRFVRDEEDWYKFGGGRFKVMFWYAPRMLTSEEATSLLGKRGRSADVASSNAQGTPEAKAERIAFHRQNITFIEGTISRLQKELAGEKDPSRRSALEWQIVCERSSVIYEQDRIRAEETGTFTASRTPFDEMCRVQQRENTRRQIQEAERLNRARRRVESLMGKMPAVEWDATDRIMDKINAEDPLDAEQWIKLGDALEKKYMGRLEYAQGMAESDLVDAEDRLLRAEKVKTRCDIALALGGVAGAPGAISLLYQTGTGFVEDGVKGAVKNAACFYCDAIDIACSTYDGYKENGLEGALKGAVWSTIMNKGVPVLASKVQGKLNTDVRDLFGGKGKVAAPAKMKVGATGKSKAGATGKAKADVSDNKEVMEAEVKRAKSEISEFIRAQNAFNQAKLEHMSDKELAKIKSDLAVATARVNENPTAKACLKYDDSYKKVGEAFDGTLGKIHETVKTRFYADMKAKGFNDQEIVQFRNASSKGTVGMDADWGLVETPNMVLTRNGKRVSAYEWQREATDSWNRSYKDTTGFDAQKSWENQTTHVDPEAYRNKKILEYSEEADNMEEILSKMSVSDAQQAFDVTRYKADVMLNNKDLPLPVRVREAVRGTAKDMKSKLIPALDVKIRALKAKQAALKKGETLSKTDAHNLTRLEAAKAHFEKVEKTFDEIGRYVGNGKDKIPPEEWDDAIRTATGGRGVLEEINDMADMFKSIVLTVVGK